jgi:DNA-binding Lrp family transcriptional regulator
LGALPTRGGRRVTERADVARNLEERSTSRRRGDASFMETVFLLIEIEVGKADEVIRRMKAVPGVAEVEAVTGPFDLIVKVQAPHINEALDTVVHRIRKIPGIKSTETLVTVGVN